MYKRQPPILPKNPNIEVLIKSFLRFSSVTFLKKFEIFNPKSEDFETYIRLINPGEQRPKTKIINSVFKSIKPSAYKQTDKRLISFKIKLELNTPKAAL